jgi:hypothetical protein
VSGNFFGMANSNRHVMWCWFISCCSGPRHCGGRGRKNAGNARDLPADQHRSEPMERPPLARRPAGRPGGRRRGPPPGLPGALAQAASGGRDPGAARCSAPAGSGGARGVSARKPRWPQATSAGPCRLGPRPAIVFVRRRRIAGR